MAGALAFALVIVVGIFLSIAYRAIYNSPYESLVCSHQSQTLSKVFDKYSKIDRNSLLQQLRDLHSPLMSSFPSECLFSDDYFKARELFRSQAKKVKGAQLLSMSVKDINRYSNEPNKLVTDAEYTTDVVILKGDPKKQLWHLSGTHGVEGYSGSAGQAAILQYLAESNLYSDDQSVNQSNNLPTLVIVHAVNPVGFAKNRRVNEENIDLNRNFLTDEKFSFVVSRDPNFAGYVEMDSSFNPNSQLSSNLLLNDINSVFVLAKSALRFGVGNIKKALVSGNYFKPTGLSFGGKELSTSAKNLIDLTQLMDTPNADRVLLIDVHTGLGPSGVDTLMSLGKSSPAPGGGNVVDAIFTTEVDKETKKVIGAIKEFGEDTAIDSGKPMGASAGYELTVGTVSEDFCNSFFAPNLTDESSKRICLTQEFGTRDMLIVGRTLTDENYAFHYGTDSEKEIYSDRLKNSFYVQTKAWRKNVSRRVLIAWLEALNYSIQQQN